MIHRHKTRGILHIKLDTQNAKQNLKVKNEFKLRLKIFKYQNDKLISIECKQSGVC